MYGNQAIFLLIFFPLFFGHRVIKLVQSNALRETFGVPDKLRYNRYLSIKLLLTHVCKITFLVTEYIMVSTHSN